MAKKRPFRSNCLLLIAVVVVITICFFAFVIPAARDTAHNRAAEPARLATVDIPESTATPTDTPTSIPVPTGTSAPTDTPTLVPTATLIPTETPTLPSTATATPCDCSADVYNCDDFIGPYAAQQCYLQCQAAGAGDVHGLDRDNDGNACEWR